MKSYLFLFVLLLAMASPYPAAGDDVRKNWFNDPFFRISKAIADCPTPAGPLTTAKERLANAHHRAERGTTCWLVGKCDRPNSYAYDRDIAGAFQARLQENNPFAGSTTLWVTVQAEWFISRVAEKTWGSCGRWKNMPWPCPMWKLPWRTCGPIRTARRPTA